MVKQRSESKDERRARILYGETTPRWGGAYRWLNDEPEEVQDYYADQPPGGVPMWKPPEQTQRQSGAVRRERQQDQPKSNFANLGGSLHHHASEPSPLKSNISGDRIKFGNRGTLAGSTANPVNSKALGAGMLARKSGVQTANFATQDQTSKKLASDASQFAVQRAKTSVEANNQEDIQLGLAQKAQSSETSPQPDKRLTLPGERGESIRNDTPATFEYRPNEEADAGKDWWEKHSIGRKAYEEHGAKIDAMAKKHGVDPDLMQAIMYMENSRGHKFGFNKLFDQLGISSSQEPMNIKCKAHDLI